MIIPLSLRNPADVRRQLQSQYEAYMLGTRPTIDIELKGIAAAVDAPTEDVRVDAYHKVVTAWPRKSQQLVHDIAREAVFGTLCRRNHARMAASLLPLTDIVFTNEGTCVRSSSFISGLGRNTCMLTVFREGAYSTTQGDFESLYTTALLYSRVTDPEAPIYVDSEFGLGDLTETTPELYSNSIDQAQLASKASLLVGQTPT